MFNRSEKTSARIDTLIGRSARIQGDVEFSGGLHIDGQVTGNVRVVPGGGASVSVSEHGVIDGSLEAPHVVLNGTVNGDIIATERVVLGAKARVRGNVSYGVIEMALGAEITGRLIPGDAAAAQTA
ncbi:MAG TPA: polymer-forming cytoskeletal protein [Steroidobacteraceae bacterium]|jgi:cytoskeletal protein CcmA (bactofilin family)|nr:polymer-forming cytoskeletal protein [Steroidobacteraceae bacterium]